MAATFGEGIKVTMFGQSHAACIGAVIDGVPSGIAVNEEKLQSFMNRRRASGELATKRHEEDKVIFKTGVVNSLTTGAPIMFEIENTDTHSKDYANVSVVPRPNHADFSAFMKYGEYHDIRGGGQFSGRLTAAMCAAGFICLEILKSHGVSIVSHVSRIFDIEDEPLDPMKPNEIVNNKLSEQSFPVIDEDKKKLMTEAVLQKKGELDSVGGEVECVVYGLESGLGSDFFGGLEALIARAVFSIPAVKGVEFGKGFEFSKMCGSKANDGFTVDENGDIVTASNNCGGILGGISSGMPLVFRAAFKPTPSISRPQQSVDIRTGERTELVIKGRHDPCIVTRAAAVVEAFTAIALVNADGFVI